MTFHTCDRCGVKTDGAHKFRETVPLVGWQREKEPEYRVYVTVAVETNVQAWEDGPELCDLCRAEALVLVANELERRALENGTIEAARINVGRIVRGVFTGFDEMPLKVD